MVIGNLLLEGAKRLDNNRTGDSYNEALVLLTYVLNKSRTYILVNRDKQIEKTIENQFFMFVDRRVEGEPISYITGSAGFMSLEFSVSPAVLIPRPETEGLVEKAVNLINKEYYGKAKILDLCTGSGCIGISILKTCPATVAVMSDLYEEALEIAQKNVITHGLEKRTNIIKSDLFEKLDNHKFDIIISNPPYVAEWDNVNLSDDVLAYEPSVALFGGKDGLLFYNKISQQADRFLNPGGYIIYEAGINQAEDISNILNENGYTEVDIRNDLSGIPRIITAKK